MDLITIIVLAFALAMDAFAVSISNGICYFGIRKKQILTMGISFGFFQAFMPVLGYFLGKTFINAISEFDHWIAFILLLIVGSHMIFEAVKGYRDKSDSCEANVCSNKSIFVQAIATSIDAFAVGVSLSAVKVNIFWAALVIGIITFLLSVVGVWIGKKFKSIFSGPAEILGGFILIGIGIKILIEGLLN